MSGLMEKDIRILLQRKQTLVVFLVIAIILSVTQGSYFIVGYLTFISVMLAISTISYDEFDNGYPFLLTLPITRKTYVIEKYIISLLAVVTSWVLAVVLCFAADGILGNPIIVKDTLIVSVAMLPVPFFFMDIMLPVQIKFGAERGRLVFVAVLGICTIVVYGGMKLLKIVGIEQQDLMEKISNAPDIAVILILLGGTVLLTWISFVISNHIMEKKEF
ncbi:MAG: ABC-2 transporter permease [Lachnospiraceae bacterium]